MKHRDLLDAVRYETAIELMQNPDNTVTDIAALPGYTDPSHFARAFRRLAGGESARVYAAIPELISPTCSRMYPINRRA